MSDNIDILCVIDVADLPPLSQDRNNPTGLLGAHIFMYVKDANGISGQGGPELNVVANIGDNVRWRETTLSSNFEYSVFFYQQTVSAGGNLLSPPDLIGGVNGSAPYTVDEFQPVQQRDQPWNGAQVQMPYHYYQYTVEATGTVTYQWRFQVNKTSDGSLVGYGTWDPYITIKN